MKELLLTLEVHRLDNGVVRRNRIPNPKWVCLRANRGTFYVEHKDTGVEIVANSRYDCVSTFRPRAPRDPRRAIASSARKSALIRLTISSGLGRRTSFTRYKAEVRRA